MCSWVNINQLLHKEDIYCRKRNSTSIVLCSFPGERSQRDLASTRCGSTTITTSSHVPSQALLVSALLCLPYPGKNTAPMLYRNKIPQEPQVNKRWVIKQRSHIYATCTYYLFLDAVNLNKQPNQSFAIYSREVKIKHALFNQIKLLRFQSKLPPCPSSIWIRILHLHILFQNVLHSVLFFLFFFWPWYVRQVTEMEVELVHIGEKCGSALRLKQS